MRYSLSLASRGSGYVSPNPMVGAVVVAEGRIIGEGWHREFGGAHAEVNALQDVKAEDLHLLPQATLFVTLEPCNHFGKTPPCTEKILTSGIKNVVIGTLDPNPLVAGKGVERLKANGVQVTVGVLEKECRELNKFFFCYHEKKRPFVTIKWAQSADGFIAAADGKPVHFTNNESDILVHKMRAEHMGILVGGKTIITDNPQLTTRLWKGKNPIRIVIDTKNNLPDDAHVLDQSTPTIVFNFVQDKTINNIRYIKIENENIPQQVLAHLYQLNINSVLFEGGTKTIQTFLNAGLCDAIYYFESEIKLGSGIAAPLATQQFEASSIDHVNLFTWMPGG